ncbi:hypothetical protein RJ639_036672 [Escallonia herrerae]|uniref:Uncharacterized protein n=1 Tax=Escallonia herrerae TaxID=1293975 RepID=A0AA88WQQ0_9ASTE|nr:hypothetical protein RJ639_036672 [Escallonia herrerae]
MASHGYTSQNTSQRPVAMALSLITALVLSPLYVNRNNNSRYETKWSSGFVLPMVLAGLIVAIKTTSSSTASINRASAPRASPEVSSWVLRIGSSSWGLAGILVMLILGCAFVDLLQQAQMTYAVEDHGQIHPHVDANPCSLNNMVVRGAYQERGNLDIEEFVAQGSENCTCTGESGSATASAP